MSNKYTKLSQERKELQEKGLVPDWYITGGYQLFCDRYEYDTNGRSVRGQFERIAKTASQHLKHIGKESIAYDKFFELLWKGWLSPSTPVLSNTGTNKGLPVSCAGNVIDDSVDGFYSSLREVAILTKQGFGTASYLGLIRPRGAKIADGGTASGVVPVFKMHVQMTREVKQGNTRRGAWAGYLPIDHDDFDELCDHIHAEPDDANVGWNVSDDFVTKLNNNDLEALRRYQRALKLKMTTGRGYFFFPDKVNRHVPQMYRDHDLKVLAAQLCVAPETQILTDIGYQTISELEDEWVNVWNGDEWSNVQIVKTGSNQELIKVKTNSGLELECTPYHKFYVKNNRHKPAVEKRAWELKSGDKLIKLETPVIEGELELSKAYENGFYSGDGCLVKGKSRIYLYHKKRELSHLFNDKINHTIQDNFDREYFVILGLQDKFFVPNADYTIESRLKWFAGLLDSDGCLTDNQGSQSFQITSVCEGFLEKVQLMLHTLGVQSKVVFQSEAGYHKLPMNNGTGENGDFYCQKANRLLVASNGILKLLELGLQTYRLKPKYHIPIRDCFQYIKIESVEWTGRLSDTYCFSEPKKHMGVFNGLLTGNCDEITLFSDVNHTYTCILSSMNLAKFDEWKDTDAVFWATVFLDCICEEFLTKARNMKGLEKAILFTEKGRALGLGMCGLHTYMQDNNIIFESLDAQFKMCEMMEVIQSESKRATQWMARELGEPEWCKGYGVRNTHTNTCPPTKSTALIMGGVSEGINPNPANTFTQQTAAGEVDRINPSLVNVMREKGVFNREEIEKIIDDNGSVQNCDWLDDHEKAVFRTAFEMNQHTLLRYAAIRNKYIDQWQSMNLFIPADTPEEVISELHEEMFNNEEIEGSYYIYTKSGYSHQAKLQCESCQ